MFRASNLYTQTLFVGFLTIISYNFFFQNKNFKLFTSLKCKYNKLQFDLRISSIEVSKQMIHITLSLYIYNTTYSKEIHLGATTLSRAKEFSVFL